MKSTVKLKVCIIFNIFFGTIFSCLQVIASDFLSAPFHQNRREELRKLMPDSSVCVLFAAPERNRSNDNDYVYHQSPDFYYLTGFNQPNALLFIFKNPVSVFGESTREVLFISPQNKNKEIWTGKMISQEEARANSGINSVFSTGDFQSFPVSENDFKRILLVGIPKGIVDSKNDTLDLFHLVNTFKNKFSFPSENTDTYLLNNYLKKLREIKQPEEIALMRRAISISCEGHKEMMRTLKPGMTEYQVQASGEYVFKTLGAEDLGYPSICGGGENSCVLHYISNRKVLKEGELIVLDMGAEYHGYSADVTRTLPVGGSFSKEQAVLYELVEQAKNAAFLKCQPGNEFKDPHKAAVDVIKNGLLSLGIIAMADDYKKYFMHGTSHYLGLDVHDAGTYTSLKPGTVITVEPGIYIPADSPCDPKWWNIGIRIEDDILITENGYENLSQDCPVTIVEIEDMMKKSSLYFKPMDQR